MQALLKSAFLQALASGLIASIWQMALLWLATILLLKSFKFSTSIKFKIAFGAQLTGFMLFICTAVNAFLSNANARSINVAQIDFGNLNAFVTTVTPYATIVYLAVLLFKLSKLILAFGETRKLKKSGLKKIPAAQRIFVQEVTALFSLHRKVSIYLSEKIICPLTTGFFKPVILIPVAAINHLTTEQLEAVILHELAHIKRADYLLHAIQIFIEKIFFFNIFSLMLGEIIEREREMACDEWVLQFRYNSLHYAEALFKIGRLKALPVLAMPLQGKKENLLLMRVKKILCHPQRNKYNFHSLLFGMLSMIITAGLFMSAHAKISSASKPVKLVAYSPAIIRNNDVQNINFQSPSAATALNAPAKNLIIKQNQIIISKVNNLSKKNSTVIKIMPQPEIIQQPNIAYQVKQLIYDSLNLALSQYQKAVNTQTLLTEDLQQKAVSYQNFKRLEEMLSASGYSLKVTEKDSTKSSYKKLLTVEATDKQGNKHIYNVEVELYQ